MAGIVLNAGRRGKLQKKRHALATRMAGRAGDYLRFAHDLRVHFDNNEAERVIRMSKPRPHPGRPGQPLDPRPNINRDRNRAPGAGP